MKIWKTLLALALAGALGAYAYWGVYKGKEKKEKSEAQEKKLLDVEKDPLAKIVIEKAGGATVTLALKEEPAPPAEEKKDGDKKEGEEAKPAPAKEPVWTIAAPIATDADETQARVVAGAFKTLSREGKVEGGDAALFGLDKPEVKVAVTTKGGKTETYEVGKKSPVGYKNYLRVGSSGEIMLVGGSFRTSVEKDLDALREKRLFFFKREDVRTVAVSRSEGEYALEQKDGKWTLAKPTEAKASATEAGKILTALTGLRVEKFTSEDDPDLAKYGLDAPRMTIAVVSGEAGTSETVLIGAEAEKDSAYARREGRPNVYVVKDKILKDLGKAPDELRENKPVSARKWDVGQIELAGPSIEAKLVKDSSGEWILESEPGEPKADKKKVEDLLTALVDLKAPGFVDGRPEDLAPYGLAEPWYTATLSKVVKPIVPAGEEKKDEKKEAEAPKVEALSTLLLGGQAEGSMYAKEKAEPWVYRIDAAFAEKLPAKLADLQPPPPPPPASEAAAPDAEAPPPPPEPSAEEEAAPPAP